jgi:hypothetical protein
MMSYAPARGDSTSSGPSTRSRDQPDPVSVVKDMLGAGRVRGELAVAGGVE